MWGVWVCGVVGCDLHNTDHAIPYHTVTLGLIAEYTNIHWKYLAASCQNANLEDDYACRVRIIKFVQEEFYNYHYPTQYNNSNSCRFNGQHSRQNCRHISLCILNCIVLKALLGSLVHFLIMFCFQGSTEHPIRMAERDGCIDVKSETT